MYFIIGASSLHRSLADSSLSFTDFEDSIYCSPGLSFVHINPSKMMANVLPFLPVGKEFIIWHDLINNSLNKHPSNKNSPLTSATLLNVVTQLQRNYNIVAMVYMKRDNALDLTPTLSNFVPHLFVLNMHNVLTSRWRKEIALGKLHLSHEIEHHMVERVMTAESFLYLAKRKHSCRNNNKHARSSR